MNDNYYLMEKQMKENARTWQKEAATLQLLKQAGLRQRGMLESIRQLVQEMKKNRMSRVQVVSLMGKYPAS